MASTGGNREIAKRYAAAFFALAGEQNRLDQVSRDMKDLGQMLAQSDALVRLIRDMTIKSDVQTKALLALAEAAQFSDLTKKLLGALAAQRRLAVLGDVIAAVEAEIAVQKGEVTADVVSAAALDQKQSDALVAALKKSLGKTVKLSLSQDAGLIGGLVIQIGSQLIDASVKTKLERLTRALKGQGTSSGKAKMKEVA